MHVFGTSIRSWKCLAGTFVLHKYDETVVISTCGLIGSEDNDN